MEHTISTVSCDVIANSHGEPTIATTVTLTNGISGTFAVPSGKSTGGTEAFVLDPARAKELITKEISYKIIGKQFDPQSFDTFLIDLDSTENKSVLGGNTTLSLSVAFLKATAKDGGYSLYSYIHSYFGQKSPLKIPRLMLNMIEGGKHAKHSVDFQEFLLIPPQNSVEKNLAYTGRVLDALKKVFGPQIEMGYEGGIALLSPATNKETLVAFAKTLETLGEKGFEISIDSAANSFQNVSDYSIKDAPEPLGTSALADFYTKLAQETPIYSLEDPFSENDWSSWESLRSRLDGKTKLIGDDLTTTNLNRVDKAVKLGAIDGVIIKPNQVGTVYETLQTVTLAQQNNLIVIVSHRGEETMDDFIADLAVGVGADFLKAGAPTQPERLAKYHRLAQIEKELNKVENN